MAKSPNRVLWDANTWISHINQESDPPGASLRCRQVLGHAKNGDVEIWTSTLALAEVRRAGPNVELDTLDKVAAFFDQPFVCLVPVDIRVGREARSLGLELGLKPQDACYLATARVHNIIEFHTFDRRVLAVDGKATTLTGLPIRICWPEPPTLLPAPLVDAAEAEARAS